MRPLEIRGDRQRIGVVLDRRAVDEGVATPEAPCDPRRRALDAFRVGDIELAHVHFEPLVDQRPRGGLAALDGAASQDGGVATLGELTADLEADAAVCAGDHRHRPVGVVRSTHDSSPASRAKIARQSGAEASRSA